ncbi:MAG: hypothetical protein RL189_2885 [Pseudomonadota bacterium]|jgi:8-oxo-dGTP pyrophosphatase MutT (NUDIX family)
MSPLLFSANSLKMHPRFAGDGLKSFRQLVLPALVADGGLRFGLDDELKDVLLEVRSTERGAYPAHLTTSCVLLDQNLQRVLLLFHRKIGEWVYPGGHADGDWHLLRSALRECFEETLVPEVEVLPPRALCESADAALCPHFFQRFEIKAAAGTPAHIHYDSVFVFRAACDWDAVHDPAEAEGVRWLELAELAGHVARGLGIVDGIDSLTAQICVRAMQSALGRGASEGA